MDNRLDNQHGRFPQALSETDSNVYQQNSIVQPACLASRYANQIAWVMGRDEEGNNWINNEVKQVMESERAKMNELDRERYRNKKQ